MPDEKAQAARDLRSFRPFLEALDKAGYEYVVIGGCAVAAYARQLDVAVFSNDLDLLVTTRTLNELIVWLRRDPAIQIAKLPRPRSIPVAVLYWSGMEVNLLTGSTGLPDTRLTTAHAREVEIDNLAVPLADPFDLLANKLAVKREKDLPHIEILKRFVEAEVVATFETETNPRRRLMPARRYLDTFGLERLPDGLSESLLALAHLDSDLRFLASTVPDSLGTVVRDKASYDSELLAEVTAILDRR